MKLPNRETLFQLFDRYGLSRQEQEELLSIIERIYINDEFQRRMQPEFAHHGELTLGEHILETAIASYIIAKKRRTLDIDVVTKIAMFHDLYTMPWQNSPIKNKRFSNRHGFRHPIEAVINASIWFPEEFSDADKAKIIIDGMAHHMFPLPVSRYIVPNEQEDHNPLELRNIELLPQLKPQTTEILLSTTSRGAIGNFSIAPADTPEGKVIAITDKLVTGTDIKPTNFRSLIAFVTGKNKSLGIKKRR